MKEHEAKKLNALAFNYKRTSLSELATGAVLAPPAAASGYREAAVHGMAKEAHAPVLRKKKRNP